MGKGLWWPWRLAALPPRVFLLSTCGGAVPSARLHSRHRSAGALRGSGAGGGHPSRAGVREGHGSTFPASPCAGAGQDVGRSCILVSIGGKNVMLDCGMHMGFSDDVSPAGGRPAPCPLLRAIGSRTGPRGSGPEPWRGGRLGRWALVGGRWL